MTSSTLTAQLDAQKSASLAVVDNRLYLLGGTPPGRARCWWYRMASTIGCAYDVCQADGRTARPPIISAK